jgi:predicted CoA-binding protein
MTKKTITIPVEPLRSAFGEKAVNEILSVGRRIDRNTVRVPADTLLKILALHCGR